MVILNAIKTPCVFTDGILCEKTECHNCKVYRDRLEEIPDNICRTCGADKDTWREVFNKEHVCWMEDR